MMSEPKDLLRFLKCSHFDLVFSASLLRCYVSYLVRPTSTHLLSSPFCSAACWEVQTAKLKYSQMCVSTVARQIRRTVKDCKTNLAALTSRGLTARVCVNVYICGVYAFECEQCACVNLSLWDLWNSRAGLDPRSSQAKMQTRFSTLLSRPSLYSSCQMCPLRGQAHKLCIQYVWKHFFFPLSKLMLSRSCTQLEEQWLCQRIPAEVWSWFILDPGELVCACTWLWLCENACTF